MSELKQFELSMNVTVRRIVTVEAPSIAAAENRWMDYVVDERDVDISDWDVLSIKEIK